MIVDDRDDRPGVKFRDIELVGIPYRITIGARDLADGTVELLHRPYPRAGDGRHELTASNRSPAAGLAAAWLFR